MLGGALAPTIQERWEAHNNYQAQIEALDLERRPTQLQDCCCQSQATAASRALASNAGYLGVVLIGAVALLLVVDMYRVRRTPLIKPDRYGQLPLSRAQIEDGQLLALTRAIALEVSRVHQLQAIHQPGQTPAHLSQHITRAPRLPELPRDTSQVEASDTLAVLPFSTLLERGRVGKGNPLLLGYDVEDESELTGSWLDLYSTAVSGMPGSGKTTSQRSSTTHKQWPDHCHTNVWRVTVTTHDHEGDVIRA